MCRTQKRGNYFLIIIQLVVFLNYYFQVGIKRVTCVHFWPKPVFERSLDKCIYYSL